MNNVDVNPNFLVSGIQKAFFISIFLCLTFAASSQDRFYQKERRSADMKRHNFTLQDAARQHEEAQKYGPRENKSMTKQLPAVVKEQFQATGASDSLTGMPGSGDYRRSARLHEMLKESPAQRDDILRQFGINPNQHASKAPIKKLPVAEASKQRTKPQVVQSSTKPVKLTSEAFMQQRRPKVGSVTQKNTRNPDRSVTTEVNSRHKATVKRPTPLSPRKQQPLAAASGEMSLASVSDSAVLVSLYESTNGDFWYNNTGWLVDPLASWAGVTLNAEGRVLSLQLDYTGLNGTLPDLSGLDSLQYLSLNSNDLFGNIPTSIGQLTGLQYLDISSNNFEGGLPDISALNQLQTLYLSYNALKSLPDLSGMAALTDVQVYGNFLTFDDIIPNTALTSFLYNPQEYYQETYYAPDANINYTWTIDIDPGLTDSYYTYYYDGAVIAEGTNLRSLNITQAGYYDCNITNSAVPGLTLTYGLLVHAPISQADSLAMVQLYNSTSGDGWYNNDGWLTGPAHTWYGLSWNEFGRLSSIYLGYNNLRNELPDLSALSGLEYLSVQGNDLAGVFPMGLNALPKLIELNLADNDFEGSVPDLSGLTSLDYFNVSYNRFSGSFPSGLAASETVYTIDLSDNDFSGDVPDLSGALMLGYLNLERNDFASIPDLSINQLSVLSVAENDFSFEDIIPNLGVPSYYYAPQSIQTEMYVTAESSLNYDWIITIDSGINDSYYEYYSDGMFLTSGTDLRTFNVTAPGTYDCFITNTAAPDLTLHKQLLVGQAIADADSLALVDIYYALDGQYWYNADRWLNGPVATWHGVEVVNGRVVGLDLSYNNLSGAVPGSFYNLTALQYVDLSGNYIDFQLTASLGNLVGLKELHIRDASIAGSLPAEIGNCTGLKVLDLYQSGLTGTIPEELYTLDLTMLDLSWNYLEGSISPSIGNLINLEHLGLSGNSFDGNLPNELWNLGKVKTFWMGGSSIIQMNGVPAGLDNFDSLESLHLGDNYLSSIPDFVFAKTKLSELLLQGSDFSNFTTEIFDKAALLPSLESLYLFYSNLQGAIPPSVNTMDSLKYLNLESNFLNDLPVLELVNTNIILNHNHFTFEDFEKQTISGNNIEAYYQRNITPSDNILIKPGETITLDATIGGAGNSYQWYGPMGSVSTNAVLTIDDTFLSGAYYCQINNETVTPAYGLALQTGNSYVDIISPVSESDSLALVQFYNDNNGVNWRFQANWLNDYVATWEGIDVENGSVVGISMYGSHINGPLSASIGNLPSLRDLYIYGAGITEVPASLGNLTNLVNLSLPGNKLSTLPVELNSLPNLTYVSLAYNGIASFPLELLDIISLQYLDLSGNALTSLPDLSLNETVSIDVNYNRLDFEDLEPYANSPLFTFYGQSEVSDGGFVSLTSGASFSATVAVGGSANQYQWYDDNGPLPGQNSPTLNVNVTTSTGYQCEITNDLLPDVYLYSGLHRVYIPKGTSAAAPSIFFNYEENSANGEGYEEGLGFAGLALDNFDVFADKLNPYFSDVDPIAQKLYFSFEMSDVESAIMSMSFTDGSVDILAQRNFNDLQDVAVDYKNGHIYYTEGCCSGGVSFIRRINVDGTGDQEVVAGLDNPIELEIDLLNNKLYWSDFGGREIDGTVKIMRSNLDGSEIETLFTSSNYDGGLKIDAGNNAMFWTSGEDNANSERQSSILHKADLAGKNQIVLPVHADFDFAFTPLKNQKELYYTVYNPSTYSTNEIYKIKYDGTGDAHVASIPVDGIYGMFAYEEPMDLSEPVSVEDSLALVALYETAGGISWTNATNWLTTDVREWYGVTVVGTRVTGINLENNNLTGKLPAELAKLTEVSVLDLSGNKLTGSIPTFISFLSALRNIDLSDNSLKGEIPSQIASLSALTTLNLSGNELIGNIPNEIGTMVNLKTLNLSANELEGEIPDTFGNLIGLEFLDLSNNAFFAELKPSLGSLSALHTLKLSGNKFFGNIPSEYSGLSNVMHIDIHDNQLEGSLVVFRSLESLSYLNVSKNWFTDLPDLTGANMAEVNATNNYLDFGDFELNASLIEQQVLTVFPQDSLYGSRDTLQNVGEDITFSFDKLGGASNTYQWYFNGSPLDGKTAASLLVSAPESPNEGKYVLEVKNSLFPGKVLVTGAINLKLSSLERDRQALIALYNSTKGSAWINKTGWTSETDLNTWHGVKVEGDRVVSIELPGNNLDGPVPKQIRDLNGLKVLDLSGNFLTEFPPVADIKSLTSVNISNNRLAFKDVIPNVALGDKLIYAPQRRYGNRVTDTLQAGEDVIVSTSLNYPGTKYQWSFGPLIPGQNFNNDVSEIAGAVSRTYLIESIDYDKQGTYRVSMTHDKAPLLTVESFNRNIWASTDLYGTVYKDANNTPQPSGEVIIYRITDGPYAAEDTVSLTASGDYVFTDVVLGDFIVLVKPPLVTDPQPGEVVPVQTYYTRAEFYDAASILEVREKIEGVDIQLVTYQVEEENPIGAQLTGVIESNFADEGPVDEEGNRVQARRKVKKAGCSMRRRTRGGGGRLEEDEYELYAYVESDDEGVFDFSGIPDGEYLLNIQYPGIPMDVTSNIEFNIGGDVQEQKFEALAIITESGISVTAYEVLSVPKPYLKDVELYPNPTEDVMRINFTVNRRISDLKMVLVTVKGEQLMETPVAHHMGPKTVQLDMTIYESGVYFLIFTDQAGSFRHQIKVGKK